MGTLVRFPIRFESKPVLIEVKTGDRPVPTIAEHIAQESHRRITMRRLAAISSGLFSTGMVISEAQLQMQDGASTDIIDDRTMREALIGSVRAAKGIVDILSTNKDRALGDALRTWLEANGEQDV